MASRNYTDIQGLNRHLKVIAGRFDDADAISKGYGFTAANTGTGTYTITLADTYNHLVACNLNVQCTSGTDDFVVSIVSETVSTDGKINIEVAVAGVLTDLGSGDEIHFTAILQNSSLPVKP